MEKKKENGVCVCVCVCVWGNGSLHVDCDLCSQAMDIVDTILEGYPKSKKEFFVSKTRSAQH